uniref:Uncharacterized protein n=1 Tax=Setaria italica TaxID=4555 RepID=K3YXK5_SETIT
MLPGQANGTYLQQKKNCADYVVSVVSRSLVWLFDFSLFIGTSITLKCYHHVLFMDFVH